jgi:hypothetical protein
MVCPRTILGSLLRYIQSQLFHELTLTTFKSQPEPKGSKKALSVLTTQFAYLAPRSNKSTKGKGSGNENQEVAGEYQQLMEQEFYDFVIFEVPWIVN